MTIMNNSADHGKVKWTVRWNDVEKIESVHDKGSTINHLLGGVVRIFAIGIFFWTSIDQFYFLATL